MSPAGSVIDTLSWLVDIPSQTGDEGRICTQIAARLLPTFGETNVLRVANSLVVGERTGRPMLLLVGHIDTVPHQGQGPARVEGGRMHGLGTTDMKSGIAVMIHLLESLPDGPFDVIGIFYEAEEGPSEENGLEQVIARAPWITDAEFAIVLEPTDREIQIGCNGLINADVVFTGTPAHSARPWMGENAITKAGELMTRLHELEPESHIIHGMEYREVMSVTRASGGLATNVIPDRFTLNVNYRFAPDRTPEAAVAHLRATCAEADEITVTDLAPAGPVEANHPIADRIRMASGAPMTAKQGWTDVARLGTHGVPAVNFGPGDTNLAHRTDESVALDDLDFVQDSLREILTTEE